MSAPVANAGPDQTTSAKSTITTLNGSASSVDNGDSIAYSWSQTAGTSVTLSSLNAAQPTFSTPASVNDQTLTFSLTVTDTTTNATATDSVNILIEAAAFLFRHENGQWVRRKLFVRKSGQWIWP